MTNLSKNSTLDATQGDAQPTTTANQAQITVADLQALARIVDLASRRGAFQAGELSQIGEAYNRLVAFLTHVENTQATESRNTTEEVVS